MDTTNYAAAIETSPSRVARQRAALSPPHCRGCQQCRFTRALSAASAAASRRRCVTLDGSVLAFARRVPGRPACRCCDPVLCAFLNQFANWQLRSPITCMLRASVLLRPLDAHAVGRVGAWTLSFCGGERGPETLGGESRESVHTAPCGCA